MGDYGITRGRPRRRSLSFLKKPMHHDSNSSGHTNNSSSTPPAYVLIAFCVDEQEFRLREFALEPQATDQVSELIQDALSPLFVRPQILEQIDNRYLEGIDYGARGYG